MINKEAGKYLVVVGVVLFSIFVFSLNHSFTGRLVSSEAPDLAVAQVGVNLHSNYPFDNSFQNNKVVAVICNNNNFAASKYDVRIVLNNRHYDFPSRGRIEGKQCVDVSTSFKPFMEDFRFVEAFAVIDPFNKVIETNKENNRLRKVLNLSAYGPNLVTSEIKLVEGSDFSKNKFKVKVCDVSKKVAVRKAFDVSISIDGIKRQFIHRGEIRPGACADVYTSVFSAFNLAYKKQVFVEANADSGNVIFEPNENDNGLYRSFTFD